MIDHSRIAIYDYLSGLFKRVTNNVYMMSVPQELTESDTTDGFIVIEVGNLVDRSEFDRQAFARVRCDVTVYVPTKSRGRLDKAKYAAFEDGIMNILNNAQSYATANYFIQNNSVLSMDNLESGNANNAYYMFIKSFIVNIDNNN